MVMKASFKSACRLFKKHIARFVTIIAIVIVSVGFMSGVGEVENKINISINHIYESQNVSDLYLKSKKTTGFSAQEVEYIENKFGKNNVEKLFSYDTEIDGEIFRIFSFDLNNSKVNKLQLLEGELPNDESEILVERKTDFITSYEINDKVQFQNKTYTVSGIVQNPLILHTQDEPSFLDENKHISNVIYINSNSFYFVNDIYITLENRELFNAYNSKYENHINMLKNEILSFIGDSNISVLSLYENKGLYSLNSYGEKIGLIGVIFVIFFLLVTLLVVYSTMSRLLDEERSQIACQKTLGYSSTKITNKYTFFVFVATLIGGLVAFGVGLALTKLIYVAMCAHYDLPSFPITYNFWYYGLTFAIISLSSTILTFVSGLKITDKKPVDLLTAKSAKIGKKVLIEKIPFVWNRLSFKHKSTLRNVFLFKSRFFMTVISIIGSSVLVLAGMGLLDCAVDYKDAASIVTISIAIIAFSAALSALVIYNITNINVSERNREIATLMVLGYHQHEVTSYIFREVYIMCFIGAVLGLPLGYVFIDFVFNLINFGSVADVNWWTWVLAPLVTMFFSFLATLLLRRKIIKTDMNASLKTLE